MSGRSIFFRLFGGFLTLLGSVGSAAPSVAAENPSILIVTIDTLRADHLGAYGYERDTSPRMDALFAEGVRYSEARTTEPLTAPALASMLTGVDPHLHGLTRNGLAVRPDHPSFPKILARRGYRTAAFVGNWTLRDKLSGLGEHFEDYEEILTKARWFGIVRSEATADDLNAASLDWLGDHRDDHGDRPFVLWVHYVEPHAPYLRREEYEERVLGGRERGKVDRYDSEIAYVDERVGDLVDAVRGELDGEELVVVLGADHGESLGEHEYWGHGRHLYEPTLRIPLGVVWPGHIDPMVVDGPVLLHDLGPTLLGLLDLPVPQGFTGVDGSSVLRKGASPDLDRVTHYQAHRGAVQLSEGSVQIRLNGLLEIGRIEGGVKEVVRVTNEDRQVYNLNEDPTELHNTAEGDPTAELAAWHSEVRSGLIRSDDLPPTTLDDEDREALEALGYLD